MAVTTEQSAPYAAPGVFVPLLARNREKGLPNPLTAEALQRLGVSDSILTRTLQTFKTLDLIGEDGKHTEILESFRRLPEAEYLPAMAQWLEAAYDHALDIIDPATADETALRDAFRNYNPISMQPRMISLFTALFEAAGVRSAELPKAATKKTSAAGTASRPSRLSTARVTPLRSAAAATNRAAANPMPSGLHPAMAGMLASLPSQSQGWTQDARDRWYAAFGVILDLAFPPGTGAVVVEPQSDEAPDAVA
jgi:hypothetical protein